MVWGHCETRRWDLNRAAIKDHESWYRFHVAFMADAIKVFLEGELKWLGIRIYLFSEIICSSDGRRGIRSPSGQQEQR